MGHLTETHVICLPILQVTEDFQAVNVSVKTDSWRSEVRALSLFTIKTMISPHFSRDTTLFMLSVRAHRGNVLYYIL